jgi:predicted ester cyclase
VGRDQDREILGPRASPSGGCAISGHPTIRLALAAGRGYDVHMSRILGVLLLVVATAHARPERAGKVDGDCRLDGKRLYGRVAVVDAFPDLRVQRVEAFPDLRVRWVDAFPDACGRWQRVDAFPDLKIQYVDAFPDLRIQVVDAFPGVP